MTLRDPDSIRGNDMSVVHQGRLPESSLSIEGASKMTEDDEKGPRSV